MVLNPKEFDMSVLKNGEFPENQWIAVSRIRSKMWTMLILLKAIREPEDLNKPLVYKITRRVDVNAPTQIKAKSNTVCKVPPEESKNFPRSARDTVDEEQAPKPSVTPKKSKPKSQKKNNSTIPRKKK